MSYYISVLLHPINYQNVQQHMLDNCDDDASGVVIRALARTN